MWLTILIIAIVIGAVIGAMSSSDGERGAGAAVGALYSGAGCLYILAQVAIGALGIYFVIWLFGVLFG